MGQINRDNYEVYFLDFIEGNLSKSQISMLNAFLANNPDLKAELDGFEAITIEDPLESNDSLKASLKREETTGLLEHEYLMISQIENTITPDEKAKLSELVNKSPDLLDSLALYHKTIISKDQSVSFPNKATLIQKDKKVVVWWQYATAAAILLFAMLNWNISNKEYFPKNFAFTEVSTPSESSNYAFTLVEEELVIEEKGPVNLLAKKVQKEIPDVITSPQNEPTPQFNQESIALVEPPIKKEPISLPKQANETPSEEEPITPPIKEEVTPSTTDEFASTTKGEFIPIDEFVKNKIKSDVLKGKTFSETVLDELSELANEKISFETKNGETQKLALNIGKFSFSRSR